MTDTTRGGCLCGRVRYRLDGRIDGSAGWCHCATCRRAAGAPAVAWLTVRRDAFAFESGEPSWFRSSDHARRGFCAACGTPLVFVSGREPGHLDVTLGSLDRPEGVTPDHHVWTEDRLTWLRLDEHLPGVPRDSVGPAEAPPGTPAENDGPATP